MKNPPNDLTEASFLSLSDVTKFHDQLSAPTPAPAVRANLFLLDYKSDGAGGQFKLSRVSRTQCPCQKQED